MPYDLLLESRKRELPLDIERYVKHLVAAVNDAWAEARERMGDREVKRQMRALSVAKRVNPPPQYEVGQEVLISKNHRNRGEHKEAMALWTGPFPVVAKVSDFLYVVLKDGREDSVHVDRIKKWHARVVQPVQSAEEEKEDVGDLGEALEGEFAGGDEADDLEGEGDVIGEALVDEDVRGLEEEKGEYEVEALLDKRMGERSSRLNGRPQVQYLIKWKNWADTYNTWENEENMVGARDMIREYEIEERARRAQAREERRLDLEG